MRCIYAFDDCSILHMCEVEIPSGFVEVLGISSLKHDNFDKLSKLRKKLESKNIKRYRFMPSTIKDKVVLVAEELIEKGGISTPWLGSGFKGKIVEKLEEFKEWIDSNFENIEKSEDIEEVKALFKSNERELIKGKNIPEDDDCRIIKGYHECIFDGSKKIISEDEHFWSYKDLILDKYEIEVIEEWNCHKIVV